MRKFKHKKTGWIAEEMLGAPSKAFTVITDKRKYNLESWFIEGSDDWEEIYPIALRINGKIYIFASAINGRVKYRYLSEGEFVYYGDIVKSPSVTHIYWTEGDMIKDNKDRSPITFTQEQIDAINEMILNIKISINQIKKTGFITKY